MNCVNSFNIKLFFWSECRPRLLSLIHVYYLLRYLGDPFLSAASLNCPGICSVTRTCGSLSLKPTVFPNRNFK